MHSMNVPIDENFLKKKKAKTFAEKMNIDDNFKASDFWFEKVTSGHGLVLKNLCGESSSINFNSISKLRKEQLKRLLVKFVPKDIFNADDTGLYCKFLHN